MARLKKCSVSKFMAVSYIVSPVMAFASVSSLKTTQPAMTDARVDSSLLVPGYVDRRNQKMHYVTHGRYLFDLSFHVPNGSAYDVTFRRGRIIVRACWPCRSKSSIVFFVASPVLAFPIELTVSQNGYDHLSKKVSEGLA